MATSDLAIGIDLGTTFSCVAVVRNGNVEVIANEQGNFITPSYVAFNEHERLIGDPAKNQLSSNSANTIFDVKRFIGRKFDDPIVQGDLKHWPFVVIEKDGMPRIQITYKNEVKYFSAEEISAMILAKMKAVAESYLNQKVKNAVVTVPAYFNGNQRSSTMNAGTIAGLNISQMINEPTAAALAYGIKNCTKTARNILVYDLGGGTFDVSILNIHKKKFEVKATGGDTHLGGQDFDNILMKNLAADFNRKHKVDISGDNKAMRRLRSACERAKRTLSSTTQATVEIDSFHDGIDFVGNISRARFENLCSELFQSTMTVVKDVLKESKLKSEDVDTIVMVGGSTRIPKIQMLLQDMFKGKDICKRINPDEAVAYGAAVQAAIIHGNANNEMENIKLLDVTPLTLGIAEGINFKSMWPVIKRNTPIPVSRRQRFVTTVDNQTTITFPILQGERYLSKDNFEIGEFTIEGIPPARVESEGAIVKFSIDINGMLKVTAVSDSNSNVKAAITIKNAADSLTTSEMERMLTDGEKYEADDEAEKRYWTARSELEKHCYDLKGQSELNAVVHEKCNEVLSWLHNCNRPDVSQFLKEKQVIEDLMSQGG